MGTLDIFVVNFCSGNHLIAQKSQEKYFETRVLTFLPGYPAY